MPSLGKFLLAFSTELLTELTDNTYLLIIPVTGTGRRIFIESNRLCEYKYTLGNDVVTKVLFYMTALCSGVSGHFSFFTHCPVRQEASKTVAIIDSNIA